MATTPKYGLRFRKLDLHLHTPASKDHKELQTTPAAFVDACIKQGLDGIAVTDHNSGQWVDKVKEAADGKRLVVFPGVEITCQAGKGGIHIIALFDPSASTKHVENVLSALGFQADDYGNLDAITTKSATEVVKLIHERGGLAVLAHANSSKGVLNDLEGMPRTQIVQSDYVHAAEGTDFQNEEKEANHKRVVDLLDGSDPTYQRKMAVYQASDAHSLAEIGSRTAFFKMENIDLDGLRQCFVDPDVRIRQDCEEIVFSYPRIKSIEVHSGFLDEIKPEFHHGLNSILGGKGSGKSLLVELLRFVLGQESSVPEIRSDHDSKLHKRLQEYGRVSIVWEDETGTEKIITREYRPAEGNPYSEDLSYDVADVCPVLFLSQNEIIRVAEDEDAQITFIDQFFDFRSHQRIIQEIETQLSVLDQEFAVSIRANHKKADIVQQIATKREELRKIDQALKNDAFAKFRIADLKKAGFESQLEFVTQLIDSLGEAEKIASEAKEPDLSAEVAEDPALKRVHAKARSAVGVYRDAWSPVITQLREIEKAIEDEYKKWKPDYDGIAREYNNIVRDAGGDYKALAQKRVGVVNQLKKLEQELATVKALADKMQVLAKERIEKLDQHNKAYEQYTKERQAKCKVFETESGGRLRVSINEKTNVEEFRRRLIELKKGSHLRESEIDTIVSKVTPTSFVGGIVNYAVSLKPDKLHHIVESTDLDAKRVEALAQFLISNYQYEDILSLQYKAIPKDRPNIQYDIGEGTFAPLTDLSVGQKATAMLLIALSDGAMPIVIDQPEDSLDLRTVWDDMCTKVRKGKERRQFIFTTHNSSLAVASDTDSYIIMKGTATRGQIERMGSMDHKPMNDDVLTYLEGGEETYGKKYRKYGVGRKT